MDIVMGIVIAGMAGLTLIGVSTTWYGKPEPHMITFSLSLTIVFLGGGIAVLFTSPPAPTYVTSAFFTFAALWLAITWLATKRVKKAARVKP